MLKLSLGKKKMSEVLKERGVAISPTGVRNVWVRYGLETKEDRMIEAEKVSQLAAEKNGMFQSK